MKTPERIFAGLCACALLAWSGCTMPRSGYFATIHGSSQQTSTGPLVVSGPGAQGDLPSLLPTGSIAGGIEGGHFDLDTSHLTYPFSGGTTDHHVHEFDDKFSTSGADFFDLPDPGFKQINAAIADPSQRFILIVSNAELSTGGVLEINGEKTGVLDFQKSVRAALSAQQSPQVFTLGQPQRAGDAQLTGLKLSFALDVIAQGGLVPTQTGCVRGNDRGANGEYRNGALLIQALDAGSYQIDPATGAARIGQSGLLWEATVFWHRPDGICYGDPRYVR